MLPHGREHSGVRATKPLGDLGHPQASIQEIANLIVVDLPLPASRTQRDASPVKSGPDPVWIVVVPLADRCQALPFVLVEPNDFRHDRIAMPVNGALDRWGNGQSELTYEPMNPRGAVPGSQADLFHR